MKVSKVILVAGTAILAVTMLSCASLRQPPDPARVRAQIAEYREQEKELVRNTVADPLRVEQFMELLDERDRLVEEHAKMVIEHREKIAALTADYDARREDFDVLFAEFNRRRAAAQRDTIDLVAAMKAVTTAAEWKVIADFQLKRLHPRQLVFGGGGLAS